jgi:transposase-like protein
MTDRTKAKRNSRSDADETLRDILIVQLAVAGLTRHQIRETAGVDMNRVTRVVKYIKRKSEG